MAKKFVGFKPEVMQKKILPSLGYKGAMDQKSINQFLAASPSAAAMMGQLTLAAKKLVEQKPVEAATGVLTGQQSTGQIQTDPTTMISKAATIADTGGTPTQIAVNTGQAPVATQVTNTNAAANVPTVAPPTTPANQMQAGSTQTAVRVAGTQQQAAQGNVAPNAQMQAAQVDPTQASSLGLQAAQQGQAQQVQAPTPMQMTADQTISGTTVDQAQVDTTLAKEQAASVKTELDDLMQDFQGGNTPSWAAGAMRNANAQMQARGLGASSMAGMAVVQAAMESALPIAQMDASNKQQMAMAKAEQRARFLGQEFDQGFQTKVKNAARVSEIANINFSAEQQVALENARMAQTVDLTNLSNQQAKVMADAATMSQMDMANLNNRQQAAKQNADSFLAMDMTNLSNEQQTTMFKAQAQIASIMSDQSADNAAKQFNATSQNQTDQFFSTMATQVSQFNSEQTNAMERFNAGEANAIGRFNTAQTNARDQFNAQNHLVIAQANAKWAQSITTADNAAANQANRDAAMAANNLTRAAYDAVLQRERDILGWAWKSSENAKQRDNNIATAKISATDGGSSAFEKGLGGFVGKLTERALDSIF